MTLVNYIATELFTTNNFELIKKLINVRELLAPIRKKYEAIIKTGDF